MKASAFMHRKDWDENLKMKGYKVAAAELLQELYNRQSAGVVSDSEINMNLQRINLLQQGIDLDWDDQE